MYMLVFLVVFSQIGNGYNIVHIYITGDIISMIHRQMCPGGNVCVDSFMYL